MALFPDAVLLTAGRGVRRRDQLADRSGRPAEIQAVRPSPHLLQVNFVLGQGNVVAYKVELGEVLRLQDPEGLLKTLHDGHWFGIEVVEA